MEQQAGDITALILYWLVLIATPLIVGVSIYAKWRGALRHEECMHRSPRLLPLVGVASIAIVPVYVLVVAPTYYQLWLRLLLGVSLSACLTVGSFLLVMRKARRQPDSTAWRSALLGAGIGFGFWLLFAGAVVGMSSSLVARNEKRIMAAIRDYERAQSDFRAMNPYGTDRPTYANTRAGLGFPDLYEYQGVTFGLIDRGFAFATSAIHPFAGYWFADIPVADPASEFALCAVPAEYGRTGRLTVIVSSTKGAYFLDTRGIPPREWPDSIESWTPISLGGAGECR